ncbi:DUF3426 domain-containing protein [Thalassospira marina]|uniref:Zinc finger/thioredoxin putative domain-containing protein n=1 Tax=Thalassospira marina TaxID=2048283 RepID=A0ABM6QC99_9PROT|nr:DUF3426 domain-containing protein [Thalassospira marina]AUG54193.1 hypothetical protein CSC3H3_16790 [Thalassospira marina]
MIITCPECSKKYSVKAESIGPKGRTVRCKNCGNSWHQDPPGGKPAAPAAPAPSPAREAAPSSFDDAMSQSNDFGSSQYDGDVDAGFEGADRIPDPPPFPRQLANNDDAAPKSKKGIIGWIVLILIIAGVGAGAFFAKDTLITLWPPIAKVYSMVGLEVPHVGEGLDIKEMPPTREEEDGVDVLVVRAEIVNVSSIDRPLPYLLIELLDPLDRVVQRKKVALIYDQEAAQTEPGMPIQEQILPVGKTLNVETKIRKPNPTATRLQVTFLDPREAVDQ